MVCKRPECQKLGVCATLDDQGNSDCFGDVRFKGERPSDDADWAKLYLAGARLSIDAVRRAKVWIKENKD
jgi:hypothetical protein